MTKWLAIALILGCAVPAPAEAAKWVIVGETVGEEGTPMLFVMDAEGITTGTDGNRIAEMYMVHPLFYMAGRMEFDCKARRWRSLESRLVGDGVGEPARTRGTEAWGEVKDGNPLRMFDYACGAKIDWQTVELGDGDPVALSRKAIAAARAGN